jgi:hypothetical protein
VKRLSGSASSVVLMIERMGVMPLPAAFGRHHVDRHAGTDAFVGPGREQAAVHALDCDAQAIVLHRRADRVGAAHVLAVDHRAQGQVLALLVLEGVLQVRRHVEGDGDRVARLMLDPGDGQWMEFAHRL